VTTAVRYMLLAVTGLYSNASIGWLIPVSWILVISRSVDAVKIQYCNRDKHDSQNFKYRQPHQTDTVTEVLPLYLLET